AEIGRRTRSADLVTYTPGIVRKLALDIAGRVRHLPNGAEVVLGVEIAGSRAGTEVDLAEAEVLIEQVAATVAHFATLVSAPDELLGRSRAAAIKFCHQYAITQS